MKKAAIVPLLCVLCLTGCAQLNTMAVQNGLVENPYYQLGDTWWEHDGIEEYYFNQIPSEWNELYRELFERIRAYEDSASLYACLPVDDFWAVYYAVLADHPEFFWVGSNISVQQSAMSGKVVSYSLTVTVPKEERAAMRAALEEAADACIASIPPEASPYQKIKAVYEYLIRTTDYDPYSDSNQNIQSALLSHASVCAGYSRAFQYILHRMGMFCTYVTGTTASGGEHAWNIVRLDDRYYNVDVTWGDPVFVGGQEGEEDRSMNYNYLCCTDAELYRTHIPAQGSVQMPECTDDSYNYYKMNGMYFQGYDADAVYRAMMNSVWEERDTCVMKFSDETSYRTAIFEIFSNGLIKDAAGYLMDLYGVGSWNYSYHTDDDFYLITIYWK